MTHYTQGEVREPRYMVSACHKRPVTLPGAVCSLCGRDLGYMEILSVSKAEFDKLSRETEQSDSGAKSSSSQSPAASPDTATKNGAGTDESPTAPPPDSESGQEGKS